MKVSLTINGITCALNYEVHQAPPGAPHLLLLHGHSSSIGEFADVLPLLRGRAQVVLLDLPGCGASSDVEAELVRAAYPNKAAPSLSFLADVVAHFVDDVVRPRLDGRSKLRVAGGSLGGNLTLFMACRRLISWIGSAVVWSPGSAWRGDLSQVLGAPTALGRAQQDWTGRRVEFLTSSYAAPVVPTLLPQPAYWYSDGWGGGSRDCLPNLSCDVPPFTCKSDAYSPMTSRKARAIESALHHANSRFTPHAAQWHWQVAADQLRYSHRSRIKLDGGRVGPRIAALRAPTLFMSGEHDNRFPVDFVQYTRALSEDARKGSQPVAFKVVEDSGHSIHNERPELLANLLLQEKPWE